MRADQFIWAAVVAVVSAVAGLLVVWAPAVPLVLMAIAAALGAVAVIRTRVPSARASDAPSDGHDDVEWDPHPVARRVYYAGMGTMALLQLRLRAFTVSDFLFLAALVIAIVQAMVTGGYRWPRLPPMLLVGLALLTAGSLAATLLHSQQPLASLAVLARVLYLFVVWFMLGAMVLRARSHVRDALGWWIGGCGFCAAWALGQRVGVLPLGVEDVFGRFSGLAEHVNDLGSLSGIVLVPALAYAYITRKRWSYLALVLVMVGLLLSGTVGAGFAVLCALLVALISPGLTRIAIVGATLATAVLLYAGFTGQLVGTQFDRFSATTDPSSGGGTLLSRVDVIEKAWTGIKHDPFIGKGLDAQSGKIYSPIDDQEHQVHNLFVGRWYESGLLGLLGIIVMVGSMLALGWRVAKRDGTLGVGLLAGTVAFLVVGLSEPILYKRFTIAPTALALALANQQLRPAPVAPLPRVGRYTAAQRVGARAV